MPLKRTTPDLSNSKTLVTGKSREYSDIDLSFTPKPGSLVYWIRYVAPDYRVELYADQDKVFSSEQEAEEYAEKVVLLDPGDYKVFTKRVGDIYKKQDVAAVIQSVGNILLTNHNEKPFDPFFGGNISRCYLKIKKVILKVLSER